MAAFKMKENIHWVGVLDRELRIFDIIMETKRGTTYNAYLINDDKVAVIDSVKNGFYEEFKSNIKEVIGDKKVDYIIVQHTELDHAGSVVRLLEDYPEAKVVGTRAAIIYLKGIMNREFEYIEAKEDLCLGDTTLKFIMAPNLHWPDTMFTYAVEKEVLFTCDFTGCHYCPEGGIMGEAAGDYLTEMKYYFDVIMGPFKRFVIMALDKIKDLKFDMVAPSHGPIHGSDYAKYLDLYREWAIENKREDKNVQIFYISAYGNTEVMAKYLAKKINDNGIAAEAHEITSNDINFLVDKIENAHGILVGSPTINQDAVKPAWDLLSLVCAITNRGKVAAAFGSYGWSGEGVPMLTERLKTLKFKVVEPGLKFNFVPSKEEFEAADALVEKILENLK